ncbi:MAG: hypothetical protein FJ272_05480, partial [Planctomycetes bacterium]|nr:hypothetical protein [Planctomycetota bacterium]
MTVLAAASALFADGIVLSTGSRAPYVHRISLYDADAEIISPKDEPAKPYSPSATCGKCHDHGRISCGWHFSEADPKAAPGRLGAPWILTDLKTGTQLPISSRAWANTYRPAEAGLTPWQ